MLLETDFPFQAQLESAIFLSLMLLGSCAQRDLGAFLFFQRCEQSGGLPCALKIVCISESPVPYPGYLGTKKCVTGTVLGIGRNLKNRVPHCS